MTLQTYVNVGELQRGNRKVSFIRSRLRTKKPRVWLAAVSVHTKVAIPPEFSGTVPNLRNCPEKNTTSFGTLNCPEFRNLYQICPDLTSRCVAVDQNAVDHFDVFAWLRLFVLSHVVSTKSTVRSILSNVRSTKSTKVEHVQLGRFCRPHGRFRRLQ